MAISIRNSFSVELAKSLVDEVQFQRANYYYFLGNVGAWSNEEAPPTIYASEMGERTARSEAVFVKKISSGDVSLVVPRFDWTAGTVYDQWDHTQDMKGKPFYVLTEEFNVYKCLYNNQGAISTQQPTGKSFYPFQTSDGYTWKYMFNIPTFKRSRFLNIISMPVQNALADSFYNRGEIESVSILNTGIGYTYDSLTNIVVDDTGATVGSGASVELVVGGPLQSILSVTVLDGGTGYTKGAKVVIDGAGQDAVLTPVIVGGVIQSVTVENGGYGYLAATATIEVGGANIQATLNAAGSIIALTIVDPGVGYVSAPTLTVVSSTLAGTGKYEGNATALVSCVVDGGKVVQANIIDPGVEYPVDNSTTIQVIGDGDGAIIRPVIVDGRIISAVVENPGSGYNQATVLVTSLVDPTTEAVLTANISTSDFVSDQSAVEQLAIPGAIHAIQVTNSGNNYTASTIVTISGNGTGCTAVPDVVNGEIVRIRVITPGQGYTYATINVEDPGRLDGFVPVPDQAQAYAILPPNNGHGSDSVNELYGSTFAVNTSLTGSLSTFLSEQDFRTYGIFKNPRYLADNTLFRKDSEFLVYNVQFTSAAGVQKDTILRFGTDRYRVFSISGNIVGLVPLDTHTVAPLGPCIAEDGITTYNSAALISFPEMNKYSGSVIYISTEEPFTFSDEQNLTIKTFISF